MLWFQQAISCQGLIFTVQQDKLLSRTASGSFTKFFLHRGASFKKIEPIQPLHVSNYVPFAKFSYRQLSSLAVNAPLIKASTVQWGEIVYCSFCFVLW